MNAPEIWKSTEPLLRWNGWTSWTIGHSFEHAFAFGRTGSGKSSTVIEFASKAALLAGYGCLFQTTKKSDTETYLKWIREAGRSDSLVMIDAKRGLGCNLLKQELDCGVAGAGAINEDATENIVRLFKFISSLCGGSDQRRGAESIWDEAAKQLLRNALNVVYAATETVEFDDLRQVVQSAPANRQEIDSAGWWRDSRCGQLLALAQKNKPGSRAVELARQYFLEEFPRLAPETRTSVTFNFSATWADLLARDPLRSLFFSKADYPMDIVLKGAVLVVDFPVDDKSEIGRLANGLARWAVQRAILRRNKKENDRPVAIVWDECQKTLTLSDVDFQATAREPRCMVLAATQSIGGLNASVGQDLGSTFLNNFNTKLFYQNQDPAINQYMADCIGKIQIKKKVGYNRDSKGKRNDEYKIVEEYAFPPQAAQNLKTGGEEHNRKVTAILTRGGQKFGGKPGVKARFNQGEWRWGWMNMIMCTSAACAKQRPAPDFRHLR
jgi:TraM recognition site of TraD and TraG